MNNTFTPTRPLIRIVFAAFALAATLATGAFIDALARSYSIQGQQIAHSKPVVVAVAQR
jgi:hypothetical protein